MSSNNESEDLAAFFAKKKAKDGKKKKVVNIDEVGAQLERKAKIQVSKYFLLQPKCLSF